MDYDCVEYSQYTGLKDKNGAEIYERDLVDYDDDIGEIKWNDKEACFEVVGKYWCTDCLVTEKMEVIGNIHENPELLGEVK